MRQPRFALLLTSDAMENINQSQLGSCLLFVAVLSICFNAKSQSIEGKVIEPDGKGLLFVNVLLLNPKDSALVKAAVTDTAGVYVIDNVRSGEYILSASMVGYKKAFSAGIHIDEGSTTTQVL